MEVSDDEDEDGENGGEVGQGDDGTSDGGKENGDDLQTVDDGEEIPILTLSSNFEEEIQSGERQDISKSSDSKSTESDSGSTTDSSADESDDGGNRQAGDVNQNIRDADVPDGSRAFESSTDRYSSIGIGAINIPKREMCPYDWVSNKVLALESYYRYGEDFSSVTKKMDGRSGRI